MMLTKMKGRDMAFNEAVARAIALRHCDDRRDEQGLIDAFVQTCSFLYDNQDFLSLRGNNKPSIQTSEGIDRLATKYYSAYRRSDFPKMPGTVPDEMVSLVMMKAYGYSKNDSDRIKTEHQKAMVAENCVGALLERYLDSVLRPKGWHWCCGSFIKAVDFVRRDQQGLWLALQIKNRDNSENSSSKAIRNGKPIQMWFRSFSRNGKTNWSDVPPLMQGFNLSEQGFTDFVSDYLETRRSSAQGTN